MKDFSEMSEKEELEFYRSIGRTRDEWQTRWAFWTYNTPKNRGGLVYHRRINFGYT